MSPHFIPPLFRTLRFIRALLCCSRGFCGPGVCFIPPTQPRASRASLLLAASCCDGAHRVLLACALCWCLKFARAGLARSAPGLGGEPTRSFAPGPNVGHADVLTPHPHPPSRRRRLVLLLLLFVGEKADFGKAQNVDSWAPC